MIAKRLGRQPERGHSWRGMLACMPRTLILCLVAFALTACSSERVASINAVIVRSGTPVSDQPRQVLASLDQALNDDPDSVTCVASVPMAGGVVRSVGYAGADRDMEVTIWLSVEPGIYGSERTAICRVEYRSLSTSFRQRYSTGATISVHNDAWRILTTRSMPWNGQPGCDLVVWLQGNGP